MKKWLILFGISVTTLLLGAIVFSLSKATRWAKHFGMTYLEFSYQLGIAVKLLNVGKSLEYIKLETGIDFTYEELRKYFLDNEIHKDYGFHIYKGEENL
jgi:hypothetical protein